MNISYVANPFQISSISLIFFLQLWKLVLFQNAIKFTAVAIAPASSKRAVQMKPNIIKRGAEK